MEETHISKKTAVVNSVWKLLESFMSKGISMLVQIVLARLIAPEAYGIIALTTVFINLTDILIQAGFATALIRKDQATEEDYSTVLIFSIFSSILLYIIIFFTAPFIAEFYDTPQLVSVLRVISLTLFCQAFASVRTAAISRAMRFRTLCVCTLISTVLSSVIGIIMAVYGFEVWALVYQQLSYQLILTILLMFAVRIKFKFKISKQSTKDLVPPSLKILSSSLLSFVGDSFYSIAIGKVYSMEELGYYDKGSLFPRNFALYTFSAVSNVFLPVFASYQKDYNELNRVFRRVLNVSFYIIIPMMAGLCMIAEPLISVILTDKWLPAIGVLRWSCLYYAATPIFLACVQLNFAIGRNSVRIRAEVIRLILMVALFFVMFYLKVDVTTISATLAGVQVLMTIYLLIETHIATKFKFTDMLKDFIPTILISGIMCGIIFCINLSSLSNVVLLILDVLAGIIIYVLLSFITKNKAFKECLGMLKTLIKFKDKKDSENV